VILVGLRRYLIAGGIGAGVGILGCLLIHRPAPTPPEQPAVIPGTAAVTVTKTPPAALQPADPPARAKPVVLARGSVLPTEPEPPRVIVQECPPDGAPAPAVANWTLRPGDLGLRDWRYEMFRDGDAMGARFHATIVAKTPDGEVVREVHPPEFTSWVAPEAAGRAWRRVIEIEGSSLGTAGVAAAWASPGRHGGYRVGAGYAFRDRAPYVSAGLAWFF